MNAEQTLDEAVRNLRALILAGENYRQVLAQVLQLGITETQALSYLAIHGECGQTELAGHLGLTSSASTALVDRLERQGIAERYAHPTDRRRLLVRLTDRGRDVVDQSRRWLAASFDRIPPDELPALAAALRLLAEDLRARSTRISSGEPLAPT
ncbi:MAG TPA: MarR family transcriptional regulator [Propionibacteriaceae bacterium]|nr:MarR family transcriptional regulator [Propionibacteriaceae bacterium]